MSPTAEHGKWLTLWVGGSGVGTHCLKGAYINLYSWFFFEVTSWAILQSSFLSGLIITSIQLFAVSKKYFIDTTFRLEYSSGMVNIYWPLNRLFHGLCGILMNYSSIDYCSKGGY